MSPGSDVMIWSPWSARATSLAVRTATPARGRQHSSVPTSAIGPNRHGAAPLERDRFRGCLLGLAAGDALGTTLEFKPPGSLRTDPADFAGAEVGALHASEASMSYT